MRKLAFLLLCFGFLPVSSYAQQRSEYQIWNNVFLSSSSAINVENAAGQSVPAGQYSIYEILNDAFDPANSALRVDCISGCGSTIIQTNGVNNAVQTTLNFLNPASFNGLTFTFQNPASTGNETFAVGGTLGDAGLTSGYSGVGACAANEWASTLTRNAAPTCTQPAFSNLSGTASASQVPNPAGDVTGTYAATTVTGVHFGTNGYSLSSTALTSGECVGYNGTNILGVTCGSAGTATALQFGTNPAITLSSTNPTSGQYLQYNGTNIIGVSGTSGPATQLQFGTNAAITLSSTNPVSGELLQYNGTNIQGYNLVCGDMPSGLTLLCGKAATTQQALLNAILTIAASPTTGMMAAYDASGDWDNVPGNTTTAQPWSWLEANGVNNGLPENLPPVEISMPSSIAAGYPDLLVTGTTTAVAAAAGSATGVIGIAEFSTGSAAWIATGGPARCTFSNTTVVGDYFGVVATGGTAGQCEDYGTTRPASVETRGMVLSAGTGVQDVWLWPEIASNGGSSAPSSTFWENGGEAAGAGFAGSTYIQIGVVNITKNLTGIGHMYIGVDVADTTATDYYAWGIYKTSGGAVCTVSGTNLAATGVTSATESACTQGSSLSISAGDYLVAVTANATTATFFTSGNSMLPYTTLDSSTAAGANAALPATIAVPAAGVYRPDSIGNMEFSLQP